MRVTHPSMSDQGCDQTSRYKAYNCDSGSKCCQEIFLSGSDSGHRGVPAQEGDISPQNQQTVAVEVPRRERHAGGQRLLGAFVRRNRVMVAKTRLAQRQFAIAAARSRSADSPTPSPRGGGSSAIAFGMFSPKSTRNLYFS